MLVEIEPLMEMMTPQQKAAQLLFVSYPWTELTSEWETHYRKCPVGGVLLREHNFQKVSQVRALVESLQDFARETGVGIPLLVAVAQEGGSTSPLSFARANHSGNMALAATRNSEYAYEAARLCAGELRSFGFMMNLAPVADILTDVYNPILGVRSFGEKEDLVSQMTSKTVKGLQENGIAACVSHFPGLGSATTDCYEILTGIARSEEDMIASDLKPFVAAIAARVEGVMLSHATYAGLDQDGFPASLSPRIVSTILRSSLAYKGLIFSDAVDAPAILERIPPQEASTLAVRAGVDMVQARGALDQHELLLSGIMDGLEKRYYAPTRVDEAVTRILRQKFRRSIDPMPFRDDPSALMLKIARDSVTVVRNFAGVLPLKLSDEHWVGILSPNPPNRDVITLGEALQVKHTWTEEVQYDPAAVELDWQEIADKFAPCETIILVAYSPTLLDERQVNWFKRVLSLEKPTVIVSLHNPQLLVHFPEVDTYVATYGYSPYSLEALVEILLGETNPHGRLPVAIGEIAPYGEGVSYV